VCSNAAVGSVERGMIAGCKEAKVSGDRDLILLASFRTASATIASSASPPRAATAVRYQRTSPSSSTTALA